MTEEQWNTFDHFEQIGRLLILAQVVGANERIRTQRWVAVLPQGVVAGLLDFTRDIGCSLVRLSLKAEWVVVYGPLDLTGVTCVRNDWKYDGPWVAELESISNARLKANEELLYKQAQAKRAEQAKQRARDLTLLANYVSYSS